MGSFSDGSLVPSKILGDDLINKAITDNATRSKEEIHEYIAAFATIDPII